MQGPHTIKMTDDGPRRAGASACFVTIAAGEGRLAAHDATGRQLPASLRLSTFLPFK